MAKISWKKVIVIGSTFLLGISTGVGMVTVAEPSINTIFSPKTNQVSDNNYRQVSHDNNAAEASSQSGSLMELERAKIVGDYKMSLAILFEAWRAPDMQAFERKISGAYTGDLKDRHLDRAHDYISSGRGLYVDDFRFDEVIIESANTRTATITASYTYTARDFDLNKFQAYGQKVDHQVMVRAELVKIGERWVISAEDAI